MIVGDELLKVFELVGFNSLTLKFNWKSPALNDEVYDAK